jgi:hypothetical protein
MDGRFEARIKGAGLWPGASPAWWAGRRASSYATELDFVQLQAGNASADELAFATRVWPPTPGATSHGRVSRLAALQYIPLAFLHTKINDAHRNDRLVHG